MRGCSCACRGRGAMGSEVRSNANPLGPVWGPPRPEAGGDGSGLCRGAGGGASTTVGAKGRMERGVGFGFRGQYFTTGSGRGMVTRIPVLRSEIQKCRGLGWRRRNPCQAMPYLRSVQLYLFAALLVFGRSTSTLPAKGMTLSGIRPPPP